MSEVEHCSWCEQIIHDERHVCWSFEAVAKSDYDKLKQENAALKDLVRGAVHTIEPYEHHPKFKTWLLKANQLLGDKR